MAGDWIKVDANIHEKTEVVAMAADLKMDELDVVGRLIRVWAWADQHTESGNAGRVTKTFIDRITRVTGFADAMENVGWLAVGDDNLTFPRFDRHNGQTAKARALTKERVDKHRRNAASVTNALPEKRREEKRREEDPNPLKAPQGAPAADADSSEQTNSNNGKITSTEVNEFFDLWNLYAEANGWTPVKARSDLRKKKVKARLSNKQFAANITKVLDMMTKDDFYAGGNDRRWTADIEYILRPSSFDKLIDKLAKTYAPLKKPPEPEGWREMLHEILNGHLAPMLADFPGIQHANEFDHLPSFAQDFIEEQINEKKRNA